MTKHFCALVFVCAVGVASQATAQVLQPPPRSSNGLFGGPRSTLDPNRVGHELSSNLSLLGSYEDDVNPNGAGPTIDPTLPRRSGTSGALTGDLRYRYGSEVRSIETSGQAFVHSFRNVGVTPMYGGNVNLQGSTRVGRRGTFTGNAEARQQPTFTLATTSTSAGIDNGVTAPVDPTIGALEMRTWNGSAASMFTYGWTGRQRTHVTYGYSRVRVTGGTSPTRSTTQQATVGQEWDVRRSLSLTMSYQHNDLMSETTDQLPRPSDSHAGNIGFQLRKRLSRTRTLSFTGGSGAIFVKTITFDGLPLDYVAPSGFFGTRLDLGRTWAVSLDAHRDVDVLDGVTAQSFLTDVANLWLGGRIASGWTAAISGTVSRGSSHEGEIGSFEAGNATAQVQYSLTRCCSLLGSYSFYTYRLRDIAVIQTGLPSRFERNAVTIGVTIFMPLYGKFPASGQD